MAKSPGFKGFLAGCAVTALAAVILVVVYIVWEEDTFWAEQYADRVEYPLKGIADDNGEYLLVRTEYTLDGQTCVITDRDLLLAAAEDAAFYNDGNLYGSTAEGLTQLYKNGVPIHAACYDPSYGGSEIDWAGLEDAFIPVTEQEVTAYLKGEGPLPGTPKPQTFGRMPYDDSLVEGIHTSPMPLYASKPFPMQDGDLTLAYYIDVQQDENGTYQWDDSQLATLLVQRGDDCYPIFVGERSHGMHTFYTFQDNEDQLGFVLIYATGAGLDIREYRLSEQDDAFVETKVYGVSDLVY